MEIKIIKQIKLGDLFRIETEDKAFIGIVVTIDNRWNNTTTVINIKDLPSWQNFGSVDAYLLQNCNWDYFKFFLDPAAELLYEDTKLID